MVVQMQKKKKPSTMPSICGICQTARIFFSNSSCSLVILHMNKLQQRIELMLVHSGTALGIIVPHAPSCTQTYK